MKKNYSSKPRRLLGSLALLFSLSTASAQQPGATLLRDEAGEATPLAAALDRSRALTLDVATARTVLAVAPPENQPGAAPLVLALPLPDGRTSRFAVWQTNVMAPGLAARYPSIKTYTGRGLDDATATVRLDLTPAGFHAQILSATTGTVYIEPSRRGDVRHYLSFFWRDIRPTATETMACDFRPTKLERTTAARPQATTSTSSAAATGSGSLLRTYRLAVATTGEYSSFHGGTRPLVQAAIVTSINRVVGVYEKELAVRLILVPNNDSLIYLDATTDPYTNNNGSAMLGENQITINARIGNANYDIGHVFSTGGGGVAGYAVVCNPNSKAQGVTGSSSPVADAFDIDYIAHEMGHQFSGSHPFNGISSSCGGGNRTADTAWEPGSGSTIMAYAGICGVQNIQRNSDAFFHVGNFEEMRSFIITTYCPVITPVSNTLPIVRIPANNLTLPIGTPFKLTAFGVDADSDTLTYNWEEIDLGSAGAPTATQVANNNVPLFRSFVPTTSPARYFPQLRSIVRDTVVIGERLPTVTRRMTFKCTVRDQHRSTVGVIGGVTSSDSLKLRVTSTAGPFLVTSPDTAAVAWVGGTSQTVTWNVAGTTANGVNCASVNIRLSTDGGYTYPTALALNVPNNGTATIQVPSVATTTARVLVEAVGNYFFDISNRNFTISSPTLCAPPTAVAVSSIINTGANVSFTGSTGATQYMVTTSPATTAQTVTASPVTLTGLTPGTVYTVNVVTVCSSSSTSVAATASFMTTAPPLCSAPSELRVTNRTLTSAYVIFARVPSNLSYTITTVPATTTQTVLGSTVTLTGLQPATNYVVRVVGNCANGATADPTALPFRTLSPPPVNDLCSAALPLTCGVRVTGTTEGVTTTGDPTGNCTTSVDGGGSFYNLVGTGGRITVSTCDAFTDYDSKLFVYSGTCGAYVCIAGNDDGAGASCGVASSVAFNSVAGTTYRIFVSGWEGDTGNFALLATCAPLANKSANKAAFRVWPNPAGTNAAFNVSLAAAAPAATVTLHNVLGQRVATRSFSGTTTELSTNGLAAGTYILTVQVAGQAPAVRRVVVE